MFFRANSPKVIFADDSQWEFKIAIYPDENNLKKAEKILSAFFKRENLNFRLVDLHESKAFNWDGTTTELYAETSDRDQRGQEARFLNRFDFTTQQYEKTPEQIKQMLLKLLKLLQDNQIVIGYVPTLMGSKEISLADGELPSPFSYSANKPTKARHGILLPEIYKKEAYELLHNHPSALEKYKNELEASSSLASTVSTPSQLPVHNPLLFKDPFADIQISKQDLQHAKISVGELLQMQYVRLEYTQKHYEKVNQENLQELEKIKCLQGNVLRQIKNMIDEFKDLTATERTTYLWKNSSQFLQLFQCWPRIPEEKLRTLPTIQNLIKTFRQIHPGKNFNPETLKQIKILFDELNFPEAEKICLDMFQDFHTYLPSQQFQSLPSCIESNPAKMQLLFRRMVHTENERKALVNEQIREKKYALLKPLQAGIQLIDITQPYLLFFRSKLIRLQEELGAKLQNAKENDEALFHDVAKLTTDANVLIKKIIQKPERSQGLKYIDNFEKKAKELKSFQHSSWASIGKAVGCLVLAGVGAVLGTAIGGVIEGVLMTLLSAPVGGVGGVFGAVDGALKGSITGWSLGMLAASSLGLTGGAGLGIRYIFSKNSIKEVEEAGKTCLKHTRT